MEVRVTHESLQTVSPALLQAYLLGENWDREERRLRGASLWRWTNEDTLETVRILAPEDSTFDDYTSRLSEALKVVAQVEGTTPGVVLGEILTTQSDVVRFASQAEVRRDGSVPVQDGLTFIRGIQETLKASAKAQVERRSFYGSLYWDKAKSFLQSARLGQTEVGSYVVTVLTRVPGRDIEEDEQTGQLTVPGAPRADRYIVETLMLGLAAARSAVDDFTDTGDLGVFQDGVSAGVSSDLCRGLARLAEGSGGAGVKVRVQWSPLLAVSPAVPSEVAFLSSDVTPLELGAESLKSVGVEEGVTVSGWVETLHREEDSPGPGIITLVADEGPVSKGGKLRIGLGAADYSKALNAQLHSSHIALEGDLVQESGRNWLHNARIVQASDTPAEFEF